MTSEVKRLRAEIKQLDNALSDILMLLKAKKYKRAKLCARLALERKLSPNPFVYGGPQ